jgi:hypothetical protein
VKVKKEKVVKDDFIHYEPEEKEPEQTIVGVERPTVWL